MLSGLAGLSVLPLFYGQYLMLFLGPAVVMAAAVLAFSRPVVVGSAFAAAAQAWVVMANQLPCSSSGNGVPWRRSTLEAAPGTWA